MKTIFLASGRSSRMDPISDKNLLEFCGEPLVLKLLKNAQQGGLANFVVVTNGENTESITNLLQEASFPAEITTQPRLEEGMSGGITAGLELVGDDEAVFILGGNDYVEAEIYQDILTQSEGRDGGILAKRMDEYFPGGYLQTDGNNRITSIIEKPGAGNEPSNLVNIVGHFFQNAGDLKQALQSSETKSDDWYEQALHQLFQSKDFVAVEYRGVWQAIKYPWHVLEMAEVFLGQQKASVSDKAQIADTAVIKGDNVVIEAGAKIFDHAVVQGPCYIGANAIVGNNALVRQSILGTNTVAGYNTEIARSFIAPDVTTHMAYVGDSVVDQGVNFGAFACTANLRLDKKPVKMTVKEERISSGHEKLGAIVGRDAQIGIHAMLMPGCKVASGELIKPGEIHK